MTGCGGNSKTNWFSGVEAPDNSFGSVGDFYLDQDDMILYKFEENGWEILGNIGGGEDGQNGEDGSTWLVGDEEPTDQGIDGDFYLDTSTYNLYQKKDSLWSLIGNIKGEQGSQGEAGQDGAAILSGALNPLENEGKDGDIYLNTMTSDIFQKIDGSWTQVVNIRGDDGITPHIGENGNWWIGDEDTGYSAVCDGESSTVSVDEEGFLIIDGESTGYNLNLTADELYENLQGVIEYDYGVTGFDVKYQSVENFEYLNNWEFLTSTFSGWAGSIGNPSEISAIKFKVRARDTAITQISVIIAEQDRHGTLLAQEYLNVDVQPYEAADIVWQLDEKITNTAGIDYFFGYSCNALVDKYGSVYASSQQIPDEEISEGLTTMYVTDGNMKLDFNEGWGPCYGDRLDNRSYSYIPVQVGEVTGVFKLADATIQEVLSKVEEELYQNSDFVLPSTIYGYVGQTMQIYFRNIIAYPLEDVYIQVSCANGKQYADRWEYTPSAAETFNLTIRLYSKNWNLISSETFSVVVKDLTSKNSARALVIGDSTVNAGIETNTMVTLSGTDETFDLTLLGTLGDGANLHEGRGGWTSNKYATDPSSGENPFYNSETQTFDFSYYMTQNGYDTDGVDVVFIQLGINDIFGSGGTNLQYAINTFINGLQIMIDSISDYATTKETTIKIVLNLIIPCDYNQDSFTDTYGTAQTVWGYMRNMYKANQTLLSTFANQENVYLSWYNAALDAKNNQGGNVHPASEGYQQLGTQMYYFLKAII